MASENIAVRSLLDIGKENLIDYAQEVILNRALPDFRDGLKPVHRRILWAMSAKNLNAKHNGPFFKCARVVGDTMGKYHPHGNLAIYDALIKMANLPVSPINGMGNFGNLLGDAYAADRYTECKLTKYGELNMLHPDYLNVTKMMPNYDGREIEPLYLPALYPNLLLNGTAGIAVGVIGNIPPLHIDSLMPFVEQAINGEEISPKKLAKKLRFNWRHTTTNHTQANNCITDMDEIVRWLKQGYGVSLYFEPKYKADGDTRTLTILEIPPIFNWTKVVENIAGSNAKTGKKHYDFVSSIDDYTDGNSTQFVIKFKTTIPRENFMDYVKLILKEFTNYTKTATNVTFRKSNGVKFIQSNVPDIIEMWADYRQKLEIRMQKKIIANLEIDKHHQDLLLLAMENIDAIAKILKTSDNPEKALMEEFKIIQEDAKYILDQALRRIARISRESVENEKGKLEKQIKQAEKYRDEPGKKVLSDMSEGIENLGTK
jgi:DNA gyrase subunit A